MAARMWMGTIAMALMAGCSEAGVSVGSYRGSDSWVYLDRFCFEEDVRGNVVAELVYPVGMNPSLQVFYLDVGKEDEFSSWTNVYESDLNCTERHRVASKMSGTALDLRDFAATRTKTKSLYGADLQRVVVSTPVTSIRSRWFFFAFGNCDSTCRNGTCEGGVEVYYSLNFTRSQTADMYFGDDMTGVFPFACTMLALWIVLGAYTLYIRNNLVDIRKYHVTCQMLVWTILLACARIACDVIFFALMRNSGEKESFWLNLSLVLAALTDFLMILMFALIMKGWTIVRRKISANGRMRLSIYMLIYISVYCSCLIYFTYAVDRAVVVYIYDTVPGYILIAMRLCFFFWILRARSLTQTKYNVKMGFYNKFSLFASFWVLTLPVLAAVNFAVDEYMKYKIVYTIELSVLLVAQLVFIELYNPNSLAFGSSFPFHATTAAMLQGRSGTKGQYSGITDSHLRQAAEISRHIKSGIQVLQTFSNDLGSFLEEIDPAEDDLIRKDEELLPQGGQGPSLHVGISFTSSTSRRNVIPK